MSATVHVLGELAIGDLSTFLDMFGSAGLDKRSEHGCLGSAVFRPVDEDGRVLVLLEWPDLDSFERFRSDPTAPPIMRKGTAQGPPTFTVLEKVSDLPH